MSEIVVASEEKQEDMTRQEAQHALAQLRGTEERQKEILLEMHERNAHRAMNYKTWEEFAEGVFGVSVRRFYQLLEAARVDRVLCRKLHILSTSSSTSSSSKFNDEMLLELAKLKDPDKIASAAREALDAASTMSYRGKESRYNGQLRTPLVKNIVNRMLSAPAPPIAAPPPVVSSPVIPVVVEETAPLTRFEQAAAEGDHKPISTNSPKVPTPPAETPKSKPVEKYTRGTELKYITSRWNEADELLRVVFELPDGTEGAVNVPGGFLP